MSKIFYYLSAMLVIASWLGFSDAAIARPATGISPIPSSQLGRLSRDLIPSASEDFFRQGQIKLERELQLSQKRQLTENLLKINPDSRSPQDSVDRRFLQKG